MRALPNTYLLSPILHKDSYELENGVVLAIDKSFENNLRERNPQLGTVEGLPDNNWLNLKIGDIIAVNHFTFYGDIGQDKSFKLKDHFTHEGKIIFPVGERQMFFKYNDKIPETLPGYLICDYNIEAEEHFGVYFGEIKYIVCTHGKYTGKEIKTLNNAMYLITLDKKQYYKVREDEVVWVDGDVIGDWMVVEYLPEKETFLDLSLVKKSNNLTVKCIKGKYEGKTLQVYRNQGVEWDGKWIIDEEMIIGIWKNQQSGQIKDMMPLSNR